MKKSFIVILICVLFSGIIFNINYVRADSGWDYDYDSGSSWDSGSDWDNDWDSGSSWDSDSDWDGNYSSSGAGVFFVFVFILVVIVISTNMNKNKHSKPNQYQSIIYTDETEENVVNKLGMSSDEFKELSFDIYKNIQNAWSNFDYEALREYTTDELYNTYVMQLETLKVKKQRNIMDDINNHIIKIFNIKDENGITNIVVYMSISMYDYVVDENGKVVRGTDKFKVLVEYEMTFVKSTEDNNVKCPNCGAEIDIVTGGKCKYCRSDIIVNPTKFVLSKKKVIRQRRI